MAKEDVDHGIHGIQFSEVYRPSRIWRISFRFCHHGKRPLLDPVKYCAYYLGLGLDFLQIQNSLRSEDFYDLNNLSGLSA
jgi:hypothetical protein